jgi:HNH endonuclease
MVLTQQQVQELFEYRDGALYWKKVSKTCIHLLGKKVGSSHKSGYIHIHLKNKIYKAHRLIFLYHHGYLPEFVDHINGNRSDNRIENLRPATKHENARNCFLTTTNASGIKGVSKLKGNYKWRCRLTVNKITKCVTGFETKELAQEFIELWREMAHGDFANHNYVIRT